MSAVFRPFIVVADDNTVIALKHIESMNIYREEEEKSVDALKGDVSISVRTVSGAVYMLSMRKQQKIFNTNYSVSSDVKELRDSIFDKWIKVTSLE